MLVLNSLQTVKGFSYRNVKWWIGKSRLVAVIMALMMEAAGTSNVGTLLPDYTAQHPRGRSSWTCFGFRPILVAAVWLVVSFGTTDVRQPSDCDNGSNSWGSSGVRSDVGQRLYGLVIAVKLAEATH
jgi:hypothetical protein